MKNAIGTTKITVTMSKATILDRTFCCFKRVSNECSIQVLSFSHELLLEK
jgi:hypothetical protein